MEILFNENAKHDESIIKNIEHFLNSVQLLEQAKNIPIIIFQDGVNGSYYIKCSMSAIEADKLCDLNAKIHAKDADSFRSNRELLLTHNTYLRMENDAEKGREFNDIIVEFNEQYLPSQPLKVWGGQHRISAIKKRGTIKNRYHGFKVYFLLTEKQRNELALISNTNMNVSNDTFDRMLEETNFGNNLREWCWKTGLLEEGTDFPDTGSRTENVTVKLARCFIVNFYDGRECGKSLDPNAIDRKIYEPYLVTTGVAVDEKYNKIMNEHDIIADSDLLEAGKAFANLHNSQRKAVVNNEKIPNKKAHRRKALNESILCAWSFVAGLLQSHPERLRNHYTVPKTNNKIPDPLNAREMANFKHDSDSPTYRGLGTRSSKKDRQRLAQVFLAASLERNRVIDRTLMNKGVSTVVGIENIQKGYITNA